MSDRFVCIITVRDYERDDDIREFADELMDRYGYDRNNVMEIRYTDKRIEFKVRKKTIRPDDDYIFEWVAHER